MLVRNACRDLWGERPHWRESGAHLAWSLCMGGVVVYSGGSPVLVDGVCWNWEHGRLLWRGSGVAPEWLPGLVGLCCWLRISVGAGRVGVLLWKIAGCVRSTDEPRMGQAVLVS